MILIVGPGLRSFSWIISLYFGVSIIAVQNPAQPSFAPSLDFLLLLTILLPAKKEMYLDTGRTHNENVIRNLLLDTPRLPLL